MNIFHILFYALLGVSLVASRRRPNNNNNNNNNDDDVVDTDDDVADTDDDVDDTDDNDEDNNQDEATSSSPSLTEYLSAKEFLRARFEAGELPIPVTVRLAFHDCVGVTGCDGCLNTNQASNAGLDGIVRSLERDRNDNFRTISHADFWQIAGIAALEVANSDVSLTFKGGREDCNTAPEDQQEHTYPDGNMNRAELMDWFLNSEDGFGMNEDQVTALSGAHSLGGARAANSGYAGPFTTAGSTFDNEYYQLLVNDGISFTNEANNAGAAAGEDLKYQWSLSRPGNLMLNTDVELVYDIDVDNYGAGTTCTIPNSCPEAATKSLVEAYANDEALFLADFKIAYEMMMEKTESTLTEPVD